jgi:transposase
MLSGNVIGDCKEHHKTEDYPAFITKLSLEREKGKTLRIIADSYNTHTSQAVKDYIEKHPGRFVLHFTPAHSSWANMIERWFAGLSNKRLRGESWSSVEKLICAVKDYIKYWNKSKRKFQRSKSADTVLSSIDKVKQAYSSV